VEEDETLSDAKFVATRIKRNTLIRVKQSRQLQMHAAECPHPVIICGDLNETPVSYITRILTKNRQDTFKEKGFGINATYAGAIPGLRIDYILPSSRLKVLNHKVYHTDMSDHYPVYSTLALKNQTPH
jgi:endonuclease/exonuclease/phosphatase (EEP) superfamily protein YafD